MPTKKSAKPEKDKSLEKGDPKNFIPEAGIQRIEKEADEPFRKFSTNWEFSHP